MQSMNLGSSSGTSNRRTYDVWFIDGVGRNHRILEAPSMSDAVLSVEQDGHRVVEAKEREEDKNRRAL